MIPRQRLDIGWSDLFAGAVYCVDPRSDLAAALEIADRWGASGGCVVSLSVRSGFDALLSVLDLPQGSEVLVSAITIRDMVRIIEAHGLIAVPVDLDVATLSIAEDTLRQSITPHTKAILVAHLFGSRMPLDSIVHVAHEHSLLVIEDCAQAYCGDEFRGHPQSDIACFSFGPIKTATALGGGLLRFRDATLSQRVEQLQSTWQQQSRSSFLRRLLKYGVLKLLNTRVCFTLFVGASRLLGVDHDQFLSRSVRGFAGDDFFSRIRRRPSVPLGRMVARRLRKHDLQSVRHRIACAQAAIARLPVDMVVGTNATDHSHWVFPIRVAQPEKLMYWLRKHGFDATRGASSMTVAAPPDAARVVPQEAERLMLQILYLPIATCRNATEVERVCECLRAFFSYHSITT